MFWFTFLNYQWNHIKHGIVKGKGFLFIYKLKTHVLFSFWSSVFGFPMIERCNDLCYCYVNSNWVFTYVDCN